MIRQEVSDEKEKSLAEIVVSVVVILLLMGSFIYYFIKSDNQIEQVSHAGYLALANSFSTQVNAIHAQWYMENKPSKIRLTTLDNNNHQKSPSQVQVFIPVNKYGWVDVTDKKTSLTACQKIWQYVMNMPMSFMKEPISVIEVNKSDIKFGRICRYTNDGGDSFEYHSYNGRLIK